jgi:hypothetical protein
MKNGRSVGLPPGVGRGLIAGNLFPGAAKSFSSEPKYRLISVLSKTYV